jgi:hypothetical protein
VNSSVETQNFLWPRIRDVARRGEKCGFPREKKGGKINISNKKLEFSKLNKS